MKSEQKQKRNRIVTLAFVSVLMLLVYGPLSQWFAAADRMLYDQLATHLPNKPLDNAFIVSIETRNADAETISATYGRIIEILSVAGASRIIMTEPPEIPDDRNLPGWAAAMNASVPVYVPTRHRLADLSTRDGFIDIKADPDGVLRRSELWQLNDGVMAPSLPLAVAFDNDEAGSHQRMSSDVNEIFLSNYRDLPRVDIDDLLDPGNDRSVYRDATVFVDVSPALVGSVATLPSGQFVTVSEIVASLLADIEQDRTIIAPGWVSALEWLAPVLLAIIAVLVMPERSRKDIAVLTGAAVVLILLLETLLLYVLHVRIDLARPMLILVGAAALSIWLTGDEKKELRDAFKRGNDFLAAGRLEPAFAEFRRCPPSETVATVMYKLSLAFEEQAKPERAEAVLEWMKRTHGDAPATNNLVGSDNTAGPQRLGRYVIERRIGRKTLGLAALPLFPFFSFIRLLPLRPFFSPWPACSGSCRPAPASWPR